MSTPEESQARLSGKAYVDGALYRPGLDDVQAYYSREHVLAEFLAGMRKWHVRLEPGEGLKHRWFSVESTVDIRRTLKRLLDRMGSE